MSRRPYLYDPPEPLVDALNDALDAMASADPGRDLAAERLRAAKALDRAYARGRGVRRRAHARMPGRRGQRRGRGSVDARRPEQDRGGPPMIILFWTPAWIIIAVLVLALMLSFAEMERETRVEPSPCQDWAQDLDRHRARIRLAAHGGRDRPAIGLERVLFPDASSAILSMLLNLSPPWGKPSPARASQKLADSHHP